VHRGKAAATRGDDPANTGLTTERQFVE